MSWLPAHLARHCSGLYDPSSTQRLAPCCAHCPLALASLLPFPPPACHAVAEVLEVECRTLLNMLQMMIGVVLPTLLAAYTARTTGQTAPAHAQQRQQQRQPPHRRNSVKPGLLGWAVQQSQRAVAIVGQACWRLNAALEWCCCPTAGCSLLQLAFALWLLSGNLWLLAKAAAL